ncbi:glutathione S-transferase A3-like isoform X2 [Lemur catta]|uniref:glutathione S-transferase A3-like isoform X2 n=1 Tax=Lemur catta TaxID=9447 RepID=UPI001E2677D7|nr:glutathione S-transferase A3-like isoform X2 [Lemur catta]
MTTEYSLGSWMGSRTVKRTLVEKLVKSSTELWSLQPCGGGCSLLGPPSSAGKESPSIKAAGTGLRSWPGGAEQRRSQDFIRKQETAIMAGKPKLHYFNARGRVESLRWLLATAGVEFEEILITCQEDLDKLKSGGRLMFQQVPMVEIDGMELVQTRAILNYFASKHNLYGKDLKERALIDMYVEGMADLNDMVVVFPMHSPEEKDAKLALIREKTTNRYFPAFEKALKTRISDLPTVKKFLQPGSQRKPLLTAEAIAEARKAFRF